MAEKTKKKFGLGGTIFFMICCAAVILGIYLTITRGKDKTTAEIPVEETEADILIAKNLEKDYPPTAREVLKLYCRITKCLYNDELTTEQFRKLNSQLRATYSDELLEHNKEEEQLGLLLGEVTTYHENDRIIYSYAIDSGINSKRLQTVGGDTTVINMYFTVKSGARMDRAYEEFSLIQDSEGRWKIAGWRGTEETNVNDVG